MIHNFKFEFELEIEGAAKASTQAAAKLDHSLQLHFSWALKALQRDHPKLKFIYPKSNRRMREKRG